MPQKNLKNRPRDTGGTFDYELTQDALRVRLGAMVIRTVPYRDIERVEKGWAPGWQVGGMGMPFRGDEVRIRVRTALGLPWMTVTPDEPDRFVERLSGRASEVARN